MLESALDYKREFEGNLSFTGEPLTRERHRLHPYPAMLHPLLVDYLLNRFATKNDIILDPFCGSGVTVLQSAMRGHDAIGFDINPFSLMIAQAKTTCYDPFKLLSDYTKIRRLLKNAKKSDVPQIQNIDYWYTPEVQNDLGVIRHVLKTEEFYYKTFWLVCFAFVCRHQSLTRNGEFKRYRIPKEKIVKTTSEVFSKFYAHATDMVSIFSEKKYAFADVTLKLKNSCEPFNNEISYDLVITSPPYGDSRTTVAYGEFSSFGNEWTQDLNPFGQVDYRVDRESLGKRGDIRDEIFEVELLASLIETIQAKDKKRSEDVLHFFNGYYKSIENIVSNLKKKGRICFVVGNRTVEGEQIPMDQISARIFDRMGLHFESIFVRDIQNKVMPSKNSPTNIIGAKKQTMMNEYIIVFSK